MTRSFPALGFDPTPGEPESVQAVLLSMSRAMRTIAATLPRLEEACSITDDADWGGSAAEEFSDHGDDLPQGLGKGAEAMGTAAEALAEWGALMKANQDKAEDLEDKAKKLKKQIAEADDAVTSAASAVPRDPGNPHYGARYDAYLGAVDAAADLDAKLEQVVDDAHRLEAKHLREADAAADGIRSGPDDAFEPENDAWYVQTLDGVSKVSGIVSAATAAAAAGLALTGVGAPAAAVLGTVSAGTAGVSALAGIGQRVAGSRNAPSNLSLALTVVPGRTVTSAAVGGVKGLARPVLGASRLGSGAKGAARGAADGFTTSGLPKLVKDVAETGRYARQTGSLREGLKLKVATDGVGQVLKGDAKLAGEAFSSSVDATARTIDASGGHLSAADKRELEALKLLANPRGDAAQNAVVNTVRDELNERDKK
ncbi:MAG: hypothetical protein GEV28_07740 [Actinophytocola sp.]|uniref:putative T7SS-secreted protein n=1 Tax=Actinophytocola sp. TaxID=1872138 RepID=UPI0013292B58|nr:hypothetical protein [Actinophytocola sp.]MPZ80279.1 hypothetical protein [Actinophytocola sp.]